MPSDESRLIALSIYSALYGPTGTGQVEDVGCRSKLTCSEGLPSRLDSLYEYLQSPVVKVTLGDTASVRYIRPLRDRKALVQAMLLEAFFYGSSTVKQDQDSEELGAFRRIFVITALLKSRRLLSQWIRIKSFVIKRLFRASDCIKFLFLYSHLFSSCSIFRLRSIFETQTEQGEVCQYYRAMFKLIISISRQARGTYLWLLLCMLHQAWEGERSSHTLFSWRCTDESLRTICMVSAF